MEKGKPNVDLTTKVFYFVDIVSFFFFSFFSFFYYFFFNVIKEGATPLYIAAQKGHEQIVQILLEKGNPNVNLATQVFLFSSLLFN